MKLSTFFIVAGMIVISLYFLIEVDYYTIIKDINENKSETPYLEIPKIGVDQSINSKSIDYGVYHEPTSAKPGFGTVVLFGHRTFYGSPFFSLDKLKSGDNVTVSWPGIGNVEYTVVNSYIVPASYILSIEQGKTLFLITCYPLGSTKERLIIQANQTKIYPFQHTKPSSGNNNSQIPYAPLFIGLFLVIGLTLGYTYPINEDKLIIFITTIILTIFLLFGFIFPVPPERVASEISNIGNLFGN